MPLLPVLGRQISVSLRSVWPTWQVPGQTEIRTETLSAPPPLPSRSPHRAASGCGRRSPSGVTTQRKESGETTWRDQEDLPGGLSKRADTRTQMEQIKPGKASN